MKKNVKNFIGAAAGIAVIVIFFWYGQQTLITTKEPNMVLGQETVSEDKFMSTDDSGLRVADMVIGTGKELTEGDYVSVHFVAKLSDGKEFDSSLAREPISFIYGAKQVILGVELGMKGMKVGGVRRLIVPPELAYGASGVKSEEQTIVPENETLTVDIQLVSIGEPAE